MGDHYAGRRQHSRVHYGNAKSHTPEILSFVPFRAFGATWLITPLVISAAKRKIWYQYVVQLLIFFNCDAISRILKKQTINIMPSDVMKWRSYFWDDAMSRANLWDNISFMQQFL